MPDSDEQRKKVLRQLRKEILALWHNSKEVHTKDRYDKWLDLIDSITD